MVFVWEAEQFSLGHSVTKAFLLWTDMGEREAVRAKGDVIPAAANLVAPGGSCVFTCGRMLSSPTPLSIPDQTENGCGQPWGSSEHSFPLCDPQIRRHGNCCSAQSFL